MKVTTLRKIDGEQQPVAIECVCGNELWRSVPTEWTRFTCPVCGLIWEVKARTILLKRIVTENTPKGTYITTDSFEI